jgi:hypothetical protein
MTGRVTRQSRQRPPNCRLTRSDGRSQGRHQLARRRAPLTARRRGGYPLSRLVLIPPATRVRFDGGNSTPQIPVLVAGERIGYTVAIGPFKGGEFSIGYGFEGSAAAQTTETIADYSHVASKPHWPEQHDRGPPWHSSPMVKQSHCRSWLQ